MDECKRELNWWNTTHYINYGAMMPVPSSHVSIIDQRMSIIHGMLASIGSSSMYGH